VSVVIRVTKVSDSVGRAALLLTVERVSDWAVRFVLAALDAVLAAVSGQAVVLQVVDVLGSSVIKEVRDVVIRGTWVITVGLIVRLVDRLVVIVVRAALRLLVVVRIRLVLGLGLVLRLGLVWLRVGQVVVRLGLIRLRVG